MVFLHRASSKSVWSPAVVMVLVHEQSSSRMRKNSKAVGAMHPRNKYADKCPDFRLLASIYPSFAQFVRYGGQGKPQIEWCDFNATRELTRVLLQHDYGVKWWIPDGQLCPAVPNRANYIHWIEDLLALCPAPWHADEKEGVRGIDIGTGANCIYPLLGASLHGWRFVGTDITAVALEWAGKNVSNNPHLSDLIEIRSSEAWVGSAEKESVRRHVLSGVVKAGEKFDFCMCNPPFFESISEANANPRTACGGTADEMVCPGGEARFIGLIISDSVEMKHQIQWFTSMVGRKVNLKLLTSKLRSLGVTALKTTEFVQGHTSRWGLAWSFGSTVQAVAEVKLAPRKSLSFTLEGVGRQWTAAKVLQELASSLKPAVCTVHLTTFSIHGSLVESHHPEEACDSKKRKRSSIEEDSTKGDEHLVSFTATVFQQAPGSLLVRASLVNTSVKLSGCFTGLFTRAEMRLREVTNVKKTHVIREKGESGRVGRGGLDPKLEPGEKKVCCPPPPQMQLGAMDCGDGNPRRRCAPVEGGEERECVAGDI